MVRSLDRSVDFGQFSRIDPLVLSLLPRCQDSRCREVELHADVAGDIKLARHLDVVIPGQGLAQFSGQFA